MNRVRCAKIIFWIITKRRYKVDKFYFKLYMAIKYTERKDEEKLKFEFKLGV